MLAMAKSCNGLWLLQAAPFVAALASCYAEAQAPPIQLFHAVLEVC